MEENKTEEITLSNLVKRWKDESPPFWKKIQDFAIALGTGAVAVLGSDQLFNLQTYGIPKDVFTIAGYVIVACAALGLSAKLTRK